MGWWVAVLTWVYMCFYLIPLIPEGKVELPLEDKFVVYTIDEEWCDGKVKNKIMRRIESIKVD